MSHDDFLSHDVLTTPESLARAERRAVRQSLEYITQVSDADDFYVMHDHLQNGNTLKLVAKAARKVATIVSNDLEQCTAAAGYAYKDFETLACDIANEISSSCPEETVCYMAEHFLEADGYVY